MNLDFGTIIGLAAFVLVIVLRVIDRDRAVSRIESRFESFVKNSEKIMTTADEILEKSKYLKTLQPHRPELSLYLSNQWKFIEKIFRNRYEKHLICMKIVEDYIDSNTSVLLDSGSTVDLITSEILNSTYEKVDVHSNNVFAAMHLVGTDKVNFHLFSGIFSERFAAVYSRESINSLDKLGIKVFILATTNFRFKDGVMVHKDDPYNLEFKRAILETFIKSKNTKLIIPLDVTKFIGKMDKHQGVVEDIWLNMLNSKCDDIIIMTSTIPKEMRIYDEDKVLMIENEIKKFLDAGVNIVQVDVNEVVKIKYDVNDVNKVT